MRSRFRAIAALVIGCISLAMAAAFLALPEDAQAQSTNSGSALLQQLMNGGLGNVGNTLSNLGTNGTQPTDLSQQTTLLQPAQPSPLINLPQSRLEQIMSARAGVDLRQFGYDQFGVPNAVSLPQVGAVQDDYIVGPGDQVSISLRGQENSDFTVSVDRDGRVLLPKLGPIGAAGRKFGDVKSDIQAAVRRGYVATNVFVALNSIRQINVQVSGEVNNPGLRTVTGLASPIDAILLSGGVKKTGSLRDVRIMRAGTLITVDLYSYLTQHGRSSNIHLADGDRIIVMPLGRTVAMAGWVRRPGIYELPAGARSIPVRSFLSLAGGLEVKGSYRLSVFRTNPRGERILTPITEGSTVGDSDIVFVEPGASQTVGDITLAGGMVLAGRYAQPRYKSLAELLRSPGALGDTPDTVFGIIVRRDPNTYQRTLIAFSPIAVLQGRENVELQSNDFVRVFSGTEGNLLSYWIDQYLNLQDQIDTSLRDPTSQNATVFGQQFLASNDLSRQRDALLRALLSQLGQPNYSTLNGQQNNGTPSTTNGAGQPQPSIPNTPSSSQSNTSSPNQQQSTYQTTLQQLAQQNPSLALATNNGNGQPTGPNTSTNLSQSQQLAMGLTSLQGNNGQPNPNGQFIQPQQPQVISRNLEQPVTGLEVVPPNQEVRTFSDLALQLQLDPLVLANFLADNRVTVDGGVRGPGIYIVGPGTKLADLVSAAGGVLHWTEGTPLSVTTTALNPQNGETRTSQETLTFDQQTLASYDLKPLDSIRINQADATASAGTMIIQGQVRYPGTYPIIRGERLSQALVRAGGLTDVAYPYGTVFLRKSAAALERDGYQRTAEEIQSQLLVAMTAEHSPVQPTTFTALQGFLDQIRNQIPLGRISIVADPSVLAAKPNLDPLLEPGDVLYIPQRPSTVTVLGEVLRQGSFPYRSENSASDYVAQAGGEGQFADSSLTFVVLPDGTARQINSSWIKFDHDDIPPGSVIVVPRDVAPLLLHDLILDTVSILSQLAIGAASIAVLAKND